MSSKSARIVFHYRGLLPLAKIVVGTWLNFLFSSLTRRTTTRGHFQPSFFPFPSLHHACSLSLDSFLISLSRPSADNLFIYRVHHILCKDKLPHISHNSAGLKTSIHDILNTPAVLVISLLLPPFINTIHISTRARFQTSWCGPIYDVRKHFGF